MAGEEWKNHETTRSKSFNEIQIEPLYQCRLSNERKPSRSSALTYAQFSSRSGRINCRKSPRLWLALRLIGTRNWRSFTYKKPLSNPKDWGHLCGIQWKICFVMAFLFGKCLEIKCNHSYPNFCGITIEIQWSDMTLKLITIYPVTSELAWNQNISTGLRYFSESEVTKKLFMFLPEGLRYILLWQSGYSEVIEYSCPLSTTTSFFIRF